MLCHLLELGADFQYINIGTTNSDEVSSNSFCSSYVARLVQISTAVWHWQPVWGYVMNKSQNQNISKWNVDLIQQAPNWKYCRRKVHFGHFTVFLIVQCVVLVNLVERNYQPGGVQLVNTYATARRNPTDLVELAMEIQKVILVYLHVNQSVLKHKVYFLGRYFCTCKRK